MTIAQRVESVCRSWLGTAYAPGQRRRGVAVDCANFVVACLAELYGPALPPPPTLIPVGVNRWELGMAAVMRQIPHTRLRDRSAAPEPGDVVFARNGANVGHVLIAGGVPASLWHAAPGSGVVRTGWGVIVHQVDRIYRPENKELWVTP
jgi:cell wall-associated NlpC family hydrolase